MTAARAAVRQSARVDGALTVLDMVVDRCPRHRSVDLVMKCPACSRRVWEHCNAIARAEETGKIERLHRGGIPRA